VINFLLKPEIKIDYWYKHDPLAMRCTVNYGASVIRPEPILITKLDASTDWMGIYESRLKQTNGKARRSILRKLRKLRKKESENVRND
jgi:hypothetical protein